MSLEEYKTQVLLLHSEQSILDDLRSGFGDRFTVHCATSGTEALNTLVDTPINVLISAYELPGMSGLDALREAKKRSPDTIGILLAGSASTDIEALVGDEEVFQVVSGDVTGDGLLQLVDNATRQMRLMALAESANDTTANVDMSAEHIVMETSANGSTIISDGTGRMPALDPKKVSAAANVGSRTVDVLVLTKDHEFLDTIKDSSRGMHKVYYANTLGQANDAIIKHKIGVAVVDAAMVGEKIEQLTQHLRKGSPRLVAIVAGRRNDGEMLMDLINRGKVYRFLLKPVSPGRARLAVEASVRHHLEAPNAAFKSNGLPPAAKPAAVRPAPKPAPPAAPKSEPTSVQKEAPLSAPKPVVAPVSRLSPEAAEVQAPVPNDPPLGSEQGAEGGSLFEDGLADAFGQDDPGFTETVTGLISSVAKTFSSDNTSVSDPEMLPATGGKLEEIPPPDSLDWASGSGGSILQNPKILGIGAAAIVVIAGSLFWFMGDPEEPAVQPAQTLGTPSFTEADVVFEEVLPSADTVDFDALLDKARLARDAGQLFNPEGNNAIELYAAAITADPDNSSIAVEMGAVIVQALSMAESAMLESRLGDATAALQRVATVDPQNARLPFLTAQLAQMQMRARLVEARVAIREVRFEDAASALSAARNLNVSDRTEINVVVAELNAARSEQQVDNVLAKASARLNAGELLSPSNDNARYYFELVLSSDADNTAALQGLRVIAGKLAFQARTEIDNGDLNGAEDTLAIARVLDPENSEVASIAATLVATRAAIAEQQRRDEADRQEAARLAAEIETATETEERSLNETPQESSATTDVSEDLAATGISVGATGSGADPAVATEEAELAPTASLNDEQSDDATLAQEPAVQASIDQQPTPMTPISSLKRIKYVAPKYPRSAQRRDVSGWVDIIFTVTGDGTVSNIEVRDSEPGQTFVNAAVKAVEKWEFEPVLENGMAVDKKAGVRMMFALE